MNLIIDIGNSRTKVSVFESDRELDAFSADDLLPSQIDMLLNKHPRIEKAIICSVKDGADKIKNQMQLRIKRVVELDESTRLPVENLYKTKDTQGKDRLAAVVGAAWLYPGKNILAIDAGTAITYDLINDRNQYIGGNISPGLEMRYKALHHFTGRLPFIKHKEFPELIGQTTEEAILAGVQGGVLHEVDATINAFKEFYKNLYVIITGGYTKFFDKKLKNSFFVHYNLVAIGLNRILEHNGDI